MINNWPRKHDYSFHIEVPWIEVGGFNLGNIASDIMAADDDVKMVLTDIDVLTYTPRISVWFWSNDIEVIANG